MIDCFSQNTKHVMGVYSMLIYVNTVSVTLVWDKRR